MNITNGSTTIVVTEPDHGRSTGDIIRFRNTTNVGNVSSATITHNAGYTITKVNDNTYNFTTGTTASSTLKGRRWTCFSRPSYSYSIMAYTLTNLQDDIRNYTEVDSSVLSTAILTTIIKNAEK